MKGKIPTCGPTRRWHWHDVTDPVSGRTFSVRSNLTSEDLAAMPEGKREAMLRRMLRDTPNPQPAREAS